MKQENSSYKTFLDKNHLSKDFLLKESEGTIIKRLKVVAQLLGRLSGVTFLLDYSTQKYLYVEETCFNVIGYPAKWLLEIGLEQYLSAWHTTDYNIINCKIFPDNMYFLRTVPRAEYSDYVFSYNYRLKNPNGEYLTILQRFIYLPGSQDGEPAGVIGIAFNITHFKNDLSIVHTIEKVIKTKSGCGFQLMVKKIHPIYDEENIQFLSKKETQVLKLVAKGLSSKQIAATMELSINTINNHRRNMLVKLQCTSASELMNYAAKHGLL